MLLFDLDGTLLNSNGVWIDVDRAFLDRRGLPYTKEYYEGVAHTTFPMAARFTRDYCAISDSEESIMAEWMALAGDFYSRQVELKPHVREFLQLCRAHGQEMAVLTSAVAVHCHSALERHGLRPLFQKVICVQDLGLEKREPDTFRKAAEMLGVRPEDCVMFDDSLLSCRAAKTAGMRVVGVHDEYFQQDLEEMQRCCHRYIRDFSQLMP